MKEFLVSHEVAAPPARVFEVFSDIDASPARIPAIVKIERLVPGPTRVGTKWKETRKMFGQEATETFEIVAFDPGRSYAMGCNSCGMDMRMEFQFHPVPKGTRVDFRVACQPRSFLSRLMAPLGAMMMGSMLKACRGDIEALGAIAEKGA